MKKFTFNKKNPLVISKQIFRFKIKICPINCINCEFSKTVSCKKGQIDKF